MLENQNNPETILHKTQNNKKNNTPPKLPYFSEQTLLPPSAPPGTKEWKKGCLVVIN